mgnify:FL=1
MDNVKKIKIDCWDVYGHIVWEKIGEKTELPFFDHQPDKELAYIRGHDLAGQSFTCIGEIVDGEIVDIYEKYMVGNQSVRFSNKSGGK